MTEPHNFYRSGIPEQDSWAVLVQVFLGVVLRLGAGAVVI